jgi:hypothetical protein
MRQNGIRATQRPRLFCSVKTVPTVNLLRKQESKHTPVGLMRTSRSLSLQISPVKSYLSSPLTPSSKCPELLDLLSSQDDEDETMGVEQTARQTARKSLYPEHLPVSQLQAGVKGGLLHQGIFNQSSWNYQEVGYSYSDNINAYLLHRVQSRLQDLINQF